MRHMFVSSSIFSFNSSICMLSILRFFSYELTSNSFCFHRRTAEICWVIFATRFQLPFLLDSGDFQHLILISHTCLLSIACLLPKISPHGTHLIFYWAVFQIIHASWHHAKLTNKREINLQHGMDIVMNSPLSLWTLFLKNAFVICKHVTVLFVFFFETYLADKAY